MNNEKMNQIIDEAYEKWIYKSWNGRIYPNTNEKESFINKCKTNPEFSETWGLKIEERELSLGERKNIWLLKNTDKPHLLYHPGMVEKSHPLTTPHNWFDEQNIPTKLITITYNNEPIEVYE